MMTRYVRGRAASAVEIVQSLYDLNRPSNETLNCTELHEMQVKGSSGHGRLYLEIDIAKLHGPFMYV